jgi:hypothetical protein
MNSRDSDSNDLRLAPPPGYTWRTSRAILTPPRGKAETDAYIARGCHRESGQWLGPPETDLELDRHAAAMYQAVLEDTRDEESARQLWPNGWMAQTIIEGHNGSEPDAESEPLDGLTIGEIYRRYQEDEAGRYVRHGSVPGGDFVFNVPADVPAVWGEPSSPLKAEGEGLLLVGPQGTGKTTLAQQYALGRMGLRSEVLGLPVTPIPDGTKLVYLAMDRPAQAARSWRRMVSEEEHRAAMNEKLMVWRGPLPEDMLRMPSRLLAWAREQFGEVAEIIVDSYKDLAANLSDEKTGYAVNMVAQTCIAEGVEWTGLHHQRKATGENKKPNKLDDVYGSGWLTAGMGSVFLLWGEAGADVVEGVHLKQPADPVGPLMILHERANGTSSAMSMDGVASTGNARARQATILGHFSQKGVGQRAELKEIMALTGASDKTTRTDLLALEEAGHLDVENPMGGAATWALK